MKKKPTMDLIAVVIIAAVLISAGCIEDDRSSSSSSSPTPTPARTMTQPPVLRTPSTISEGAMSVSELLESPVYGTEVKVYGTVSALGELFCPCFALTTDGKILNVHYDLMTEDDGTERPPASVEGIENGDRVLVTGELMSSSGTAPSTTFWASNVEKTVERGTAQGDGTVNIANVNELESFDYDDSQFISGIKMKNIDNIPEISEITFQLANELKLDYILVPITYKNFDEEGNVDWSKGMDYYHIFELSNKYDVSVLPAFYKLGGQLDKDAQRYADFVIDFLDEFENENIKYIELQNEPMAAYDAIIGKGHHFAGTPTDLARSTIAVYDEVKKKYPEIIVGSPGFLTSSVNDEENNKLHNEYLDEYLSANPKFDVFMLHNYPKSRTYLQELSSDDKYNFMSEYDIFKTYRTLLDDYGYENTPILVTEGLFDIPLIKEEGTVEWAYLDDEEVSILLAERFVLAMSNKHNNVIGSMVSGLESDYNFALFNYNRGQQDYTVTNKYDFYKKILSYTREYPIYSKHIAGAVNSQDYWIEEFKNKEDQKMWLAFCPLLIDAGVQVFPDHLSAVATNKKITCPQNVELNVGNVKEVKIDYGDKIEIVKPVNGIISFVLDKTPVFIESVENFDEEKTVVS